jgi:large subunit ribosomal protein L14e
MSRILQPGQLVFSCSGRDKGRHYLVVGFAEERVLVADGKSRRLDHPKKKNPLHLKCRQVQDKELGIKLQSGQKVTNSELRGALSRLLELENNETPRQGGEDKLG